MTFWRGTESATTEVLQNQRQIESHSLRHIIRNKQVAQNAKPTLRTSFVFGMSDMQFCKARVRAVKAKTD
jgi:hypothetical protein